MSLINDLKINDLKFGVEKEEKEIDAIRKKFDVNLKKIEDKFSLFDFESENCLVELKSRRNSHNKYSSTMVGYNKVLFASKSLIPVYFVFSFDDGLYYWKYSQEDVDGPNIEIKKGGRSDRGRKEIKDYVFINTNILNKI
jgi:hypothetical protein